MLRKTLTILSLIGLLLSVGLWGVSRFGYMFGFSVRTNSTGEGHYFQFSVGNFDNTIQIFYGRIPQRESARFVGSTKWIWKQMPGPRPNPKWWRIYMVWPLYANIPLWIPTLIFALLPAYALLPPTKIERAWLRILVAVIGGGIASVVFSNVVRALIFTVGGAWFFSFIALLVGPTFAAVLVDMLTPSGPKDGHTRCGKCGYILKGLTEPRCSECGERI